MSQEQYNSLMSNLLKQKRSLTKLRKELEGRKGKLCFSCRKFRHLAQNCRNKEGEEKGEVISQNKFEMLSSRVIRCKVELRRQETEEKSWVVECFKCGEEEHKCRECPLWERERKMRVVEEAAHVAMPQKVQ